MSPEIELHTHGLFDARFAGWGESENAERERLLGVHAEELYEELTDGLTRSLRIEQLVYEAAERVPGLTPTPAEMEAERQRPLSEKTGVELSQGLLISAVLSTPRTGVHLVRSMLEPTPEALERIDEFRSTGVADLGPAH